MATHTAPDTQRAARLFHALSDGTRLSILQRLRFGERCVCDLTDALDAAQSRLSFHLKVLKDAGLVTDRREGRWMYYTLNTEALAEVERARGRMAVGAVRCGAPDRLLLAHAFFHHTSTFLDEGQMSSDDIKSHRAGAVRRGRAARSDRSASPPAAAVAAAPRPTIRSLPTCTPRPRRRTFRPRPCWPRSGAATPPRWPSCTKARWCSTWARAAASMSCSRPTGSARPARRTGST